MNAARLHETPLHHAAKNMRVEMIEILLEFGANIYARDQHDRKPVDYTTPGSPSAACLQLYESQYLDLRGDRKQSCVTVSMQHQQMACKDHFSPPGRLSLLSMIHIHIYCTAGDLCWSL